MYKLHAENPAMDLHPHPGKSRNTLSCLVMLWTFPHSYKQWHRVEVGVDKNTVNVWKCPPQPCSGAIVRTHWSGMRERSIACLKKFTPKIILCFYLTSNFHVAVHLFRNRSPMMSKCGKSNWSGTLGDSCLCHWCSYHIFDVFCDLLGNRWMAT